MFILCLSIGLLFSTVSSIPVEKDRQAVIKSYENTVDADGNYHFSYETSNGIYRTEEGKFVDDGKSEKHLVVEGFFTYSDPDGEIHNIRYKADENGYQILPPMIGVTFGLPSAAVATLLG